MYIDMSNEVCKPTNNKHSFGGPHFASATTNKLHQPPHQLRFPGVEVFTGREAFLHIHKVL